jgi:uncharacterized protein YegP (UPF0339 family)
MIDIYLTNANRWRWQVIDEDGRVIAYGAQEYLSEEEARKESNGLIRLLRRTVESSPE